MANALKDNTVVCVDPFELDLSALCEVFHRP